MDLPGPMKPVTNEELPGLSPVIEVVAEVAEAFVAAGHALYLVGGVVRDLLLGSFGAIDDIDMTTDATPSETKSLIAPLAGAVWSQGERFGTIGATIAGRHIEITTHRAEAYDAASRKPVVSFGTSIFEDLARRDFTINAMAISLPERELLDPHGGRDDLEARVLRTPLSPEVSFTDDPLRMMRAARFLPRFELEPETGLRSAARNLAGRLAIVSVERVHDELERLLAVAGEATRGLSFLSDTGLLDEVIPAIVSLDETLRAEMVSLVAALDDVVTRRAGLFFPLGAGAGPAMQRLRYRRGDQTLTTALIEAAEITLEPDVSAGMVRGVVDRLGLDHLAELAELSRALHEVRRLGPADDTAFFVRLAQLSASEDLSDLASPLTGGQIIEGLGLEPGPLIGDAVAFLRQRRLEEGPMSDAQAFEALTGWLR